MSMSIISIWFILISNLFVLQKFINESLKDLLSIQ